MSKIAILGLHLNFGGIEQSIINQANALCEEHEVELAITYNLTPKLVYDLNSKVKIKYLTNDIPNKETFYQYLKAKKFLKTFKEGLKSLKILHHKFQTMKNYIKHTDANIIISSRLEFTKILAKYSQKGVITIAEEHVHHNNNSKYIQKIIKSCQNIDYLVAVSTELTNFYKKLLPNTKCVYIPNFLNYWPKFPSKLNNKNLISIGRLSKEKGFLDLIDTFQLICQKDNEFHLDIIGDGEQKSLILAKIKEYHLQKNITMHGFQKREFINTQLLNSTLYLMTSYEESFGMVLIEAASFGLPQIAFSSAQGAREIIKDSQSGYLIENRNKEAMATKVIELINNQPQLKKFSQEARLIAQQYSFEKIKLQWLDFIKEVTKC